MAAHSPGPWTVCEHPGHRFRTIRSCADVETAVVWTPADARLIAAAPELLEALIREHEAHPGPQCPGDPDCPTCALLARLTKP